MNILLRGYYGFGNFGDDLLLCVCYSIIRQRYPQASVCVFANFSDGLLNYTRAPRYREYIYRLVGEEPELLDWRDQRYFDLEIYGGGGVFKSGLLKNTSLIGNLAAMALGARNVSRFFTFIRKTIGRNLRIQATTAVALGIGVERYSCLSGNLLRDVEQLGRLHSIFMRDSASSLNAKYLGVSSHTGTDLAFLLKERVEKKRIVRSRRRGIAAILCAGKRRTDEVLSLLMARRAHEPVTLIFFDENHDEELIKTVSSDGFNILVWQPQHMAVDDFLEELAQFSLIISNRFHGLLCAAMLDIPSIALETDSKLESVYEMLPNSVCRYSLCQPLRDLDLLIDTTMEDNCLLTNEIDRDVSRQYQIAEAMISNAFGLTNV